MNLLSPIEDSDPASPEILASLRGKARDEQERLFQVLDDAATAAFSRRGLVERRFVLLGRVFVLRCAGSFLAENMGRALAHLRDDRGTGAPELTIDCWDCASSGLSFPMPQWPAAYFAARGEIMGLDSPDFRVTYFRWLKLLNVFVPGRRRAFYCLDQERSFSLQQMGSPALTLFNWWAESHGSQLVHAAAVGTEEGGVLVAGYGGAGKSTLAFSTLGTDLRYIGDDYCLIAGPPAQAVSLFSSGKLTEQSLEILPHLRSRTANFQEGSREKALFYLAEEFPGGLLPQAPLRAIVLPRLSTGASSLVPAESREAYRVIAESTLRQLAGTNHHSFIRLRRLIDGLPVFWLNLGRDQAATHRILLQQCAS